MELVPAVGVRLDVRWGDGQWAVGLMDTQAMTLARALGHSVSEVADSYRDPDGLPVFGPVPGT